MLNPKFMSEELYHVTVFHIFCNKNSVRLSRYEIFSSKDDTFDQEINYDLTFINWHHVNNVKKMHRLRDQ